MRLHPTLLALIVAHVCINSAGYLVVKVALREFGPLAFAFWRFILGLAGLFTVMTILRAWPKVERHEWPRFLLLGLLAVPANQLLYLSGMRYTVPSHASLIYGVTAAAALLLSVWIGYEKLARFKLAAIALAVAGVALVVSDSPTRILGTEGFHGDVLIFFSMLAWAGYTVLAKPLVTKYGAVRTTLVCLMIGSLIGLPFLVAPALLQDYSIITWHGWLGVAYSGILITTVSYTVWFAMLRQIDPSQVAILTTPQPVVTTTLSVLILGEAVGLTLITGGLMVIGGVLLMQAPALWKRKTKPVEPVRVFDRKGQS